MVLYEARGENIMLPLPASCHPLLLSWYGWLIVLPLLLLRPAERLRPEEGIQGIVVHGEGGETRSCGGAWWGFPARPCGPVIDGKTPDG